MKSFTIQAAKSAFGSFFVLETDAVGNGDGSNKLRALEAIWKQQSTDKYNYSYGQNEQVILMSSSSSPGGCF